MLGSEILEVGIGLVLIYLLLSAMASALREALEAWFKTRGEHLERGIRELLRDPDGSWMARGVYEHPLVAGLFRGGYNPRQAGASVRNVLHWLGGRSNLPSYIPAPNFAAAVLDIVARGPVLPAGADDTPPPAMSVDLLRANAGLMANPYLQRALLVAIDRGQNDLNRVQANLEAWYNSGMDRVSGWYKRRTQWVLLVIGLGLTLALNVNTITIADFLMRDSTARAVLVRQAETISRDSSVMTAPYKALNAKLDSLKLPIGWADPTLPRPSLRWNDDGWSWWVHLWQPLMGLLITAFAVSLGAPFWFDILNKFMVIRSTVKPHEKSPEEASEDRQKKGGQQSSQRIGGALPGEGEGEDAGAGNQSQGTGGGSSGSAGTGTTTRTVAPVGTGAGTGTGSVPGTVVGTTPATAGDDDADFEPHRWNANDPDEGVL